jgi:hypothetical protein
VIFLVIFEATTLITNPTAAVAPLVTVAPGGSVEPTAVVETTDPTAAIETTTTEEAKAGDTIIKTVSIDGFAVGDTVGFGAVGSSAYETGVIASFSSIVLTAPLKNNHPVGTVVTCVDCAVVDSGSGEVDADLDSSTGGSGLGLTIIIIIVVAVLVLVALVVVCKLRSDGDDSAEDANNVVSFFTAPETGATTTALPTTARKEDNLDAALQDSEEEEEEEEGFGFN